MPRGPGHELRDLFSGSDESLFQRADQLDRRYHLRDASGVSLEALLQFPTVPKPHLEVGPVLATEVGRETILFDRSLRWALRSLELGIPPQSVFQRGFRPTLVDTGIVLIDVDFGSGQLIFRGVEKFDQIIEGKWFKRVAALVLVLGFLGYV